MALESDDLEYYIAFVLLDEARRPASGKRQTAPLKGEWMSCGGETGMRLSDRRFRRAVCIEARRSVAGLSVDKAAAEVAEVLGESRAEQVNVIRVGYYEWKRRHAVTGEEFLYQFLHWRAWVFESDEETIQVCLKAYPRHLGQPARDSLAELISRLRNDPQQRLRNRAWLLEPGQPARNRIDSNYWNPDKAWQQLATDLWMLGRRHAGIGDEGEARILLSRALDVWQTHGHKLVWLQEQAIPILQAEIDNLQELSRPDWHATMRQALLNGIGYKLF
jgi:hypothetical protein